MSSASNVASTSYKYPAGQLGHLSSGQQTAFETFKELCEERGHYKSSDPPSHDDATLLRYLRARHFQVEPAYEHFSTTELYRKQNRLLELYDAIDVEEYEQTRKLYPQWTGRRDKLGFPITVFEVAKLDMKAVHAYERTTELRGIDTSASTASTKILRLFALYEFFSRFVTPWASSIPDRPYFPTPITQGTNIVDISGMGIRQYWDLRVHLQESSSLSAAHYPETLHSVVVIGAPSFFSTIFSWIKRFIDPGVVAKMRICPSSPSELLASLQETIDIADIPKKYGGQLDWKFGDMPTLDQSFTGAMTLEKDELPIGPLKWEEGKDGDMLLVAIGTRGGSRRRDIIDQLDRRYEQVFFPKAREPTASA